MLAATSLDTIAAAQHATVDIVTEPSAFLDLEAAWNDAVERAGVPHPFLRHEWIRTWWDNFGGAGRLHIIVVRHGETVTAIAPLMTETVRMYGLSVRRMRLLHNEHTPRIDFIVAGRHRESYRRIWDAIASTAHDWDVLQLGQVPRDSETLSIIQDFAEADGCPAGIWPSGDAPFLRVHGRWDDYYNGLSAKFRQNLRNRLSRLTRIGTPALETLDDHLAVAERDEAFRLEASGWKDRDGTAINADPAVHNFYSQLAERAADNSWLRLLFLTVEGRRIAVSYGARYANRLFLLKTGYDPEFEKCSPFKLLTYFASRDAFTAGFDEVDFLGDSEPWKLEWTSTTRPHEWLFVFGRSPRARLLHSAKFQIAPALKKWRA